MKPNPINCSLKKAKRLLEIKATGQIFYTPHLHDVVRINKPSELSVDLKDWTFVCQSNDHTTFCMQSRSFSHLSAN